VKNTVHYRLILLLAFWRCESRGDQCAPHKSRQGGCNAHATLSAGEPGNRALRRSIASTSSPFLRRDASERTGSITGQWIVICPCFTPARCLREGETAVVLVSESWTHLVLMSVKVSLAYFHFKSFKGSGGVDVHETWSLTRPTSERLLFLGGVKCSSAFKLLC